MIIRIGASILFVFGFIISFKDYKIIFKIIGSRIINDDYIVIQNKTFSVQDRTWKPLLIVALSASIFLLTLFTLICSWIFRELDFLLEILSLLLPLNYSIELSKISLNEINKFLVIRFSIEDMKNFKNPEQLKNELKAKKQYLSEKEANELNDYFYGNKKYKWVKENGFKPKLYQKELEKRQKNKIK